MLVMPDDLTAFAWSAPMRDLAARLNLSDVGLKKLLTSYGIVSPPQGYWNRVHAGRPVPEPPRSAGRGPGSTGRLRVDSRFAGVVQAADPLPSSGPFATKLVPEDLEELRANEIEAIGRASVPRSLDNAHNGLRELLKKEEKRRIKTETSGYHWDSPLFDNPLAKRRLRLLNGIFQALSKRGYSGSASERNGEIHAGAAVGQTHLSIEISIVGRHATILRAGYSRPDPDLPASTPLRLALDATFDRKGGESWSDDNAGSLESKIVQIVAGIIVTAEATFRRSLREEEERAERQRIAAEQRRQERLVARNRKRVEDLLQSGELLRQAQDIRALVANVQTAITEAGNAGSKELEDWVQWAKAEADCIDPVRSGQYLSHFLRPVLDDRDW